MSTFSAAAEGDQALIAAVIGQAAVDLADGDHGAAAYFLSDHYRRHLQLLGLPDDLLPAGWAAADLLALSTSTSRRRRPHANMPVTP